MSRSETNETVPPEPDKDEPSRTLSPAAQRALAEAAERRQKWDNQGQAQPKELGGKDGPDPVRYGDWENGGIASDF